MNKIVRESKIWDMHIHTCNCTKASGEFSKLSCEEYISKIISIFSRYEELGMFSFTDHNIISVEVYREYIKQGGVIPFLVGVEVDTKFEKARDFKHVIIYLDITKENFESNIEYINEINEFLQNAPISINELLDFLIGKKKQFVLSPHSFKQDKRGIDYDWYSEDITNEEAHKYMDQFFCFWEAAGKSEVARAINFLNEFEMNDRISIIAFSDSNNFNKLEKYLSNPNQYFDALPNFKGLQMIASEFSRIRKRAEKVSESDLGNLIGTVEFEDNQIIEFSNKLNCIIGGRGSGKSLLLDAIAHNLKDFQFQSKNREEFVLSKNISIKNYAGTEINKNNFLFDYFPQGYVSKLFDSMEFESQIRDFFKDEFNKLLDIDFEEIKNTNKEIFNSFLSEKRNVETENISNIISNYKIINDEIFKNILKKNKAKPKKIEYIKESDYNKNIAKIIPKKLIDDEDICNCLRELNELIVTKTHEYNKKLIDELMLNDIVCDEYKKYKDNRSNESKVKSEIEHRFKNQFEKKTSEYLYRVNIINAYSLLQKDFNNEYEIVGYADGEIEKAFMVKNKLDIEQPFSYLEKKLKEYFYSNDLKENGAFSLDYAIHQYCYNTTLALKDGKSRESLDDDLVNLELEYNYHPEIYYLENHTYQNIETLSPGTQTNILMEYLVCKETSKPLLIDQPEDNIDNQTIYGKLRSWFRKLKNKRQVIVVTHDANITINADADNVIIASHEKVNEFVYGCGALEYEDILDISSDILDGGKEAVKRRLMKYGA
ncbi:MAG: hypothetical protein Q4C49_07505 [Bacillota bacterium]|nr:hypothetical protein [Bacillota bacterium]